MKDSCSVLVQWWSPCQGSWVRTGTLPLRFAHLEKSDRDTQRSAISCWVGSPMLAASYVSVTRVVPGRAEAPRSGGWPPGTSSRDPRGHRRAQGGGPRGPKGTCRTGWWLAARAADQPAASQRPASQPVCRLGKGGNSNSRRWPLAQRGNTGNFPFSPRRSGQSDARAIAAHLQSRGRSTFAPP